MRHWSSAIIVATASLALTCAAALAPGWAQRNTTQAPGQPTDPASLPDQELGRKFTVKAEDLPPPRSGPVVSNRPLSLPYQGQTPRVPEGFTATAFAVGLEHPRRLLVLPNGDVLVAESEGQPSKSPNTVTLLRDKDGDGRAETKTVFLRGVRQPFGLLLVGDSLYVANTNALVRLSYRAGETTITAAETKILDLPAGGYNNHWTRNVIANADGTKLFISVGSGTNVDEEKEDQKDQRRAAILEANPDGSAMRIYASGLRNPVGLALHPETKELWTVVNERDMLGDELVPDYLTSVKEGAFYGWPYSYFGPIEDPRKKGERPDLVAKAIPPITHSARTSRRSG
jgi:glucose/arabinose dehydrogenase